MRELWERVRILVTGKVAWDNPYTGQTEEVDQLGWADRWSIFGVHSSNWWWVHRYGELDCGCVRNPLTRRMVLFWVGCAEHCVLDTSDAALLETEP